MGIAEQVARRSTCNRAQVGAIIVRQKRILTTGYNGAPRGMPHCTEAGCEIVDGHCVRTIHAEQNAIIQAAVHGVSIEGGDIYTTHHPCVTCAKMIINAGLRRVVYSSVYYDPLSARWLAEAGVEVIHLDRPV